MKYLLDTDICIYIIKKKPQWVYEKFNQCMIGDIAISSVTLSELSYGVEKSQYKVKNREALSNFILPLSVLSFDDLASDHYGKIQADLETRGEPIRAMDLMIAAHASSLKLILVTNNTREFSKVKNLSIENWTGN